MPMYIWLNLDNVSICMHKRNEAMVKMMSGRVKVFEQRFIWLWKYFLISPFISLYPVHLCFLPLSINLSFLHYGGVYPYLSGFFLGLRWGTTLWQRSSDDSSTNSIVAESHREDGTNTKSSILRCACGQFPPSRLQHLTPQPVNSAISS